MASIIGNPLPGFLVVMAPVSVRVEQPLPAFFSGLGRTECELYHAPALVVPAAERFQTVVPAMLIRLAHGETAQARESLRHARRQRVPFPIVPGILAVNAVQHFGVQHVQRSAELLHRGPRLGRGRQGQRFAFHAHRYYEYSHNMQAILLTPELESSRMGRPSQRPRSDYGKKLVALREAAGLTQQQLADQ